MEIFPEIESAAISLSLFLLLYVNVEGRMKSVGKVWAKIDSSFPQSTENVAYVSQNWDQPLSMYLINMFCNYWKYQM